MEFFEAFTVRVQMGRPVVAGERAMAFASSQLKLGAGFTMEYARSVGREFCAKDIAVKSKKAAPSRKVADLTGKPPQNGRNKLRGRPAGS